MMLSMANKQYLLPTFLSFKQNVVNIRCFLYMCIVYLHPVIFNFMPSFSVSYVFCADSKSKDPHYQVML